MPEWTGNKGTGKGQSQQHRAGSRIVCSRSDGLRPITGSPVYSTAATQPISETNTSCAAPWWVAVAWHPLTWPLVSPVLSLVRPAVPGARPVGARPLPLPPPCGDRRSACQQATGCLTPKTHAMCDTVARWHWANVFRLLVSLNFRESPRKTQVKGSQCQRGWVGVGKALGRVPRDRAGDGRGRLRTRASAHSPAHGALRVSSDWLCLPGAAGPTQLATSRVLTGTPTTRVQDLMCQTQVLCAIPHACVTPKALLPLRSPLQTPKPPLPVSGGFTPEGLTR